MSKFNHEEDGIVGEVVCGIVGVAAAGIVGWLLKQNVSGKEHLPQIKRTKDRLFSAVKSGIEGWKSYPSHVEETLEAQPEEKNPFEDTEEGVNPFDISVLPEIKVANTDREFEETLVEHTPKTEVKATSQNPQKSKPLLKKCSRRCGSVLQGLDIKVGICSNCQSKMRCKSCNNQLKKEEWGSALCLPCIQGTQCDECRAITPLGKEVKHARSCSHFKPTLSEKIVLPSETASVEPQEDFLEALEAEVAETTLLAVCENCGQMYSGSTCDKCDGTNSHFSF